MARTQTQSVTEHLHTRDNKIYISHLRDYLDRWLPQIPEEHRASAYLYANIWGADEPELEDLDLCWERPETDEELARRVARERAYQEDYELRERVEYARLRQKFGATEPKS